MSRGMQETDEKSPPSTIFTVWNVMLKNLKLSTHLITKNFDLTITSVGDIRVTRILECVDLYVQRKTLKADERE